jgi:hypothetical protein
MLMIIKHKFTLNDLDKLNTLFKDMLYKTPSIRFKHLGIHHTYITFQYLMGDIEIGGYPLLELPMQILLLEDQYVTSFCLVEQYTSTHFELEDSTKFEDLYNDIIFINQSGTLLIGTLFASFEELYEAIQRILDYTFLLVLDDVSHYNHTRH